MTPKEFLISKGFDKSSIDRQLFASHVQWKDIIELMDEYAIIKSKAFSKWLRNQDFTCDASSSDEWVDKFLKHPQTIEDYEENSVRGIYAYTEQGNDSPPHQII